MVERPGAHRATADLPVAHAPEHPHPGAKEYVVIAVILAVVTGFEVAAWYMNLAHEVLTALLLVLSAVKFSLVVLFFMHLKFDSRLFSSLFVGGLILAGALLIALLALFNHLFV